MKVDDQFLTGCCGCGGCSGGVGRVGEEDFPRLISIGPGLWVPPPPPSSNPLSLCPCANVSNALQPSAVCRASLEPRALGLLKVKAEVSEDCHKMRALQGDVES